MNTECGKKAWKEFIKAGMEEYRTWSQCFDDQGCEISSQSGTLQHNTFLYAGDTKNCTVSMSPQITRPIAFFLWGLEDTNLVYAPTGLRVYGKLAANRGLWPTNRVGEQLSQDSDPISSPSIGKP